MDKKYNGFNNGRDKSDGVGGREVNHGTQQSMTKAEMIYPKIGIEPKQFTDTHQERCYPLTVVSDLMDEWAAQEVSKEREEHLKKVESVMKMFDNAANEKIRQMEKAKKLVEALECIIRITEQCKEDYVIDDIRKTIKQSLIEYGQPNSL